MGFSSILGVHLEVVPRGRVGGQFCDVIKFINIYLKSKGWRESIKSICLSVCGYGENFMVVDVLLYGAVCELFSREEQFN